MGITAAGLGGAALATGGVLAALGGGAIAGMLIDMIPKLFGSKENFSDMIGGVANKIFGPDLKMQTTYKNYNKDSQITDLMAQYNKDLDKGDKVDADALYKKMDELVTAMAIADGRDPAKAIESLHKTIKNQHQENKAMTQEQIDATKGQTDVRLVKSNRIASQV